MLGYTTDYVEARDHWAGISDGPARQNRAKRKGIPVFRNGFVEHVLARSHWVLPGVWFFPLIAFGSWRALAVRDWSVPAFLGLVAAGVLAWTALEYALHRWVMHLPTGTGAIRRDFLFMAHGYHHEFPDDPYRLVAPPLMSWPLAALVAGAYYLALGPAWEAVFAGTLLGYVAYDWTHYYTHHARPTSRLGKFLRKYHIQHHFRDHDAKFGISSPLWDLVLGTYGAPVNRAAGEAASEAASSR